MKHPSRMLGFCRLEGAGLDFASDRDLPALSGPHTETNFEHQISAYPQSSHQLTPATHAIRIITTEENT